MYRQADPDRPPLPPDAPARRAGRYHSPGDPWPLYAALTPAGAWAEWAAHAPGVDPEEVVRRLWTLVVTDLPVLDLRSDEVRAALGVSLTDLVDGYDATQRLARVARASGAAGIIVPSAALADAWNLVVFPRGLARVKVTGSTELHPVVPPGVRRPDH